MIAFNPSSTIAVKGEQHLEPVLDVTDILIVNDEEAELIAHEGDIHANLEALTKEIPTVIITRGSDGVIAHHDDTRYSAEPHQCTVQETTGAGDAFSSGFLAAHLHDLPSTDRIKLGMLNAENVLCHYGAHNDLLNWEQARSALRDDERDVREKPVQ
ncbi:MAG: carbohydrate kinase family protein [Halobacteriaceae archaeon]